MIIEIHGEIFANTSVLVGNLFCPFEIFFTHALEDRIVKCATPAGRIGTADRIGVALGFTGAAVVRQIAGNIGVVSLQYLGVFVKVALIITSEEGYGTLECFNIDPSSAAAAVIDNQAGKFLKKRIPHTVHTRDMLDLRDSTSIFLIVFLKILCECCIKILPVTGKLQRTCIMRKQVEDVAVRFLVAIV